jgi:hypothetical protein
MSNIAAVHSTRPVRFFSYKAVISGKTLAILGAIALAIAGRLVSGWDTPLWFDETFSAVIANQPNPSSLLDWCLAEIGGPIYYVLLWVWAHLFGTQATTLRLFSLVCSLGVPLVAWRFGSSSESVRLYWAALLALWTPAFDYASNARCYSLLLLINTLQAIAFLRLQRTPTRKNALAWTALSVLGILTHYHTAVLAGVQGVLFLASHRRAAVRCWPALVTLIPLACWMAFHLPILLRFSSTGSWYPPLTSFDLLISPVLFFESGFIGVVLGLGWIIVSVARWRGWHVDVTPAPEKAVALSGIIAIAIILLISMIKPSFTWRYAAVYAPSILFGVALWIRALKPQLPFVPMAVLAMFAASASGRIVACLQHPGANYRFAFNLDQPSAWLGQNNPHHLGFLLDNPTGTMSDPRRMAEVAGFFLRQAGHPVAVSIVKAWPGTDPGRLVGDRVRDRAIDSIIWISDPSIPGTLAPVNAGLLAREGWQCHDFGSRSTAVLACRPRAHVSARQSHGPTSIRYHNP